VVVAACSWAVAFAGAEIVLRVRSPLVPLVPFVVGTVVPLVLGAGGSSSSGLVLGTLTVGAAALVLVRAAGASGRFVGGDRPRHVRGRRRSGEPGPAGWAGSVSDGHGGAVGADGGVTAVARLRRRRVVAAVPVVLLAGVVPLVLRDQLPLSEDEPRFDPRGETRGAPPDVLNPLAEVSAQRNAPQNEELFVVRATDGVGLWRLAVLDSFDGGTWGSSATFAPAGRELPRSVPGGGGSTSRGDADDQIAGATDDSGARVRQDVTIRELDSPFLPVAGRAVELEGHRVRFDPAGGMVLAERPADEGTTYQVESVVADPSDARLDVTSVDRSGSDTAAAGQPVLEAAFLTDVAIAEVTNRSPGLTGTADMRALRALQAFFADQARFRLATEPTSGLSLRQLTELVRTGLEGGPSQGSIEQFAAAYAVMARTLGFPARVVAGYRTVERDPDGLYHVDRHDAFAWTEVKLQGLGWVPFVAAPVSEGSSTPTQVSTSTTSTTLGDEGEPTPTTEAGGGSTPERRRDGGGRPWWLAAGLAVAGVAGLALVTAPILRWRRRWRRAHQPDVARRIDGAWRELLDRLAAQRVPVTGAMTATEVVQVTGAHLGATLPMDAYELAALVNLAHFGPLGQPPAAATAAWSYADRLARWVGGHLPRTHRLRAWFDPRPLRT
jgi:hypothetical protein